MKIKKSSKSRIQKIISQLKEEISASYKSARENRKVRSLRQIIWDLEDIEKLR